MTHAYYNENNPYAADWLRNLITAGHIAPGDVDTRSIEDITPNDIRHYTQCHFFAGIGVWSFALRRAGWPDDRAVWTGSCPCQPFSAAGKGAGFADERHLWPAWYHLIRELQPRVVFGEQVASKDGLGWLDLVHADLEAANYAVGSVDLCAAGVGAPHIRQRLWFVAEGMDYATGSRHDRTLQESKVDSRLEARMCLPGSRGGLGRMADADREQQSASRDTARGRDTGRMCSTCRMAYDDMHGRSTRPQRELFDSEYHAQPCGCNGRLGDAGCQCDEPGRRARDLGSSPGKEQGQAQERERLGNAVGNPVADNWTNPLHGPWRDADWLLCRDGKWRPVEPGTFPLAHGAPARVGRLRAYGNGVVWKAAEAFIRAYSETQHR